MNGGGGGRGGDEEQQQSADTPALQVIVLGSGGGPQEFNTTSFLIRSTSAGWGRGSLVALDAGVHLSAITRILEQTLPQGLGTTDALALPYTLTSGPFEGLEVPYESVSANAGHVLGTLIDTYLITHPHLDHIAGFVINTAGLPGTRPKRLAGLPTTIAAFKAHIFNNVIWPNLSDENNGAGLVTYMRLVEGGSLALGDGEGKGYLELSDGLSVKIMAVSHGHCIERHSHRGSGTSTRYGSLDGSSMGPLAMGMGGVSGMLSPRIMAQHNATSAPLSTYLQQQQQQQQMSQSSGVLSGSNAPSGGRTSMSMGSNPNPSESICVYDSSAYFVRDVTTGREILMFGDVEPDSVSLSPRNGLVWAEAGPKVAAGKLAAVFIECSYDDSQTVDRLFGHLTPRYVIEELSALAAEVETARVIARDARDKEGKKRKREDEPTPGRRRLGRHSTGSGGAAAAAVDDPVSPKTVKPSRKASGDDRFTGSPHLSTPTAELSLRDAELSLGADVPPSQDRPLRGLKVVIIHVKEKLKDGPSAGETILQELLEHEEKAQLGCEYVISYTGQSIML